MFDKYRELCRTLADECATHKAAITTIFLRQRRRRSAPTESSGGAAQHRDRVDAGAIVAWLLEHYSTHLDLFQVAQRNLGIVKWNAIGYKGSWYSLEGVLLFRIECKASDSVLNTVWMQMEDPVNTALAVAPACPDGRAAPLPRFLHGRR